MSDELSPPRWRTLRTAVLQFVAVVVLCCALGSLAGLLWHRLWTPSTGLVWDHVWQKGLIWIHPKTLDQGWSENAHQDVFSATAIFVLLTAAAGLVAGVVASFALAASEFATLVALVVGGLAGAVITRAIGFHLSAADPAVLAKHAANSTMLPDRITLAGPALLAVFPGVALLVLVVVFLGVEPRARRARSDLSLLTDHTEPSPLG